jgi:hypothetical protein
MATKKKLTLNAKTVVPKPTGRPSKFSQALADEIVERVSNGEPLAPVCRDLGLGLTTWYQWCKDRPDLSEAIARAREAGEEIIAADALRIIDEEPSLNITQFGSSYDSSSVTWAKNRAELRLKLLAKWNPRKWGDKIAVGGADDLPALQSQANVTLDPSEAYKRLMGGKS